MLTQPHTLLSLLRKVVRPAILALTAAAVVAPSAQAVSCWGDYCSGKDPQATGCSAGSYTTAHARIPGTWSNVELRWSPTCRTNWARVSSSWGAHYPWQLRAFQCATGYAQSGVSGTGGGFSWTRMIYSPVKTVRAEWNGTPGSAWTWCA